MATLITIYWRDIPAQVLGRRGHERPIKKALDPRFQHAIDRAAMRAGRGSSDQYLDGWRRERQPCEGDLDQAVRDEVARLERKFTPEMLDRMARAGGLSEESDP